MSTQIGYRKLEQRIRTTVQQDGLVLTLSGISLAIMGLFFYDHRMAGIAGGAFWIWPALLPVARARVTFPRIGYYRLPKARILRQVLVIAAALILVLLGARSLDRSSLSWLEPLYWGIALGVTAILLGLWSGYKPYLAFAALFLASGLAGLWLQALGLSDDLACAVQFWGLAAVLIPAGVAQLVRFLRRNPPQPDGDLMEDSLHENHQAR